MELSRAGEGEPLRLPTNIRHTAGGAEASLAQLILTWAQRTRDRQLETFISSQDYDQIEDFVRRFTGIVATFCADEIVGNASGLNLTKEIKNAALNRLSKLQGRAAKEAYRGLSTEILCVDHIGRGEPYLLYQKNDSGGSNLRTREEFRSLADWLIRKSIPEKIGYYFSREAASSLGGMLYEVFKNTNDHALSDISGNLYSTSIRAIRTNHLRIMQDDLQRIVQEYRPLADYCSSLEPQVDGRQLQLFEMSILDSGPGFACSWTKRPLEELTDLEEEAATRRCFERGSSKGESRFGEGLPHVLRLLAKERGFLRLRTGRITLFADFSASTPQAEAQLLQRFSPDGGPVAAVSGSLLSLIIPLRRAA